VVLAAGEGKRMRSARPKVLHLLGGRPLVGHAVDLTRAVGVAGTVVVVGHQGDLVRAALAGEASLRFADQGEPRGTGHALLQAKGTVPVTATEVLLLYADVPLLRPATVGALLARHRSARAAATVLTFRPPDPSGYGRVLRRGGRLARIVEERDATPAERRLRECNAGIYVFDPEALWPALEALTPRNAQGEFYLTDAVAGLARRGRRLATVPVTDPAEVAGVNDRRQLADVERVVRARTLDRLLEAGVTVLDPAATYVDAGVAVAPDVVLYPGVRLEGRTRVSEGAVIGTGCQVTDTEVGAGATLRPYTVALGARIAEGATVGPFTFLRPGTVLEAGARAGAFVEAKEARLGRGARVPHLAYVGDAVVGPEANVGAGTITCNFDGTEKRRTEIGARAFIGSNSSLVAPVRVGDEAYVAAGSVITEDVPDGALAVARGHQAVKPGWVARRRARAVPPPGPGPAGR
jgi:bifunctional UDP-N-acetylglucosamine pyrophosphorylase/glucosamine-1-phosphate N-acetyltransferase